MTSSFSHTPSSQEDSDFLGADGEDQYDWLDEPPRGPAPGRARFPAQRQPLDAPQGQVLDFIARVGLALVVGWALIGVGVLLLIIGYFQVSSTANVAVQLSYLSAQTAAGMFLAVAGSVLVISQHYQSFAFQIRELRREQQEMMRRLDS